MGGVSSGVRLQQAAGRRLNAACGWAPGEGSMVDGRRSPAGSRGRRVALFCQRGRDLGRSAGEGGSECSRYGQVDGGARVAGEGGGGALGEREVYKEGRCPRPDRRLIALCAHNRPFLLPSVHPPLFASRHPNTLIPGTFPHSVTHATQTRDTSPRI